MNGSMRRNDFRPLSQFYGSTTLQLYGDVAALAHNASVMYRLLEDEVSLVVMVDAVRV